VSVRAYVEDVISALSEGKSWKNLSQNDRPRDRTHDLPNPLIFGFYKAKHNLKEK